ncbi:hypothetical protein BofuT4_uP080280.1 [Botrytis cinerea T4]|uniref:Uncharacterized protein n=1 Tax=Botryotinia fuckeliana (strain T4) TaxID=999810 RepID=G2YKT5_BOTF4|nr:hypothetical protein BofuT4_uP080280.1 [Botrytis cinerea T4]
MDFMSKKFKVGSLSISQLSFGWWEAAKMTRRIKCMRSLELCVSRIECISFTGRYAMVIFSPASTVQTTCILLLSVLDFHRTLEMLL